MVRMTNKVWWKYSYFCKKLSRQVDGTTKKNPSGFSRRNVRSFPCHFRSVRQSSSHDASPMTRGYYTLWEMFVCVHFSLRTKDFFFKVTSDIYKAVLWMNVNITLLETVGLLHICSSRCGSHHINLITLLLHQCGHLHSKPKVDWLSGRQKETHPVCIFFPVLYKLHSQRVNRRP